MKLWAKLTLKRQREIRSFAKQWWIPIAVIFVFTLMIMMG